MVEELSRAWSAALEGHGTAVCLVGDSGIGKSRLARAALESAARDGAVVLEIDCTPSTGNTPLLPVGVLLRRLAGIEAGASEAERATAAASFLSRLPAANVNLLIEKNHVRSSSFDGIRLNQTDNSMVRGNKSEGNDRDGIRLQNDSDLNTISNNLSRDNGRDGMRVDGGVQSDTNTIEQNSMLGNAEHD